MLLAFALGLTSAPTASWAAPISMANGALVNRSATVAPVTAPSSSGDLGVLLLDWFASVADTLAFYQDAVATEDYLGTACDTPC
ncbi:MAG TPA: hypothetical protein VKV73_22215 [Chloroflexota bacterium]|nr:hypothetical protein [Chloroflexota bacterium]